MPQQRKRPSSSTSVDLDELDHELSSIDLTAREQAILVRVRERLRNLWDFVRGQKRRREE